MVPYQLFKNSETDFYSLDFYPYQVLELGLDNFRISTGSLFSTVWDSVNNIGIPSYLKLSYEFLFVHLLLSVLYPTYEWNHILNFLWLILRSMIFSRCIHIVANGSISFFLMTELYFIGYMYHIFIQSSIEGHFCCFHVLDTENKVAFNVMAPISLQINIFKISE